MCIYQDPLNLSRALKDEDRMEKKIAWKGKRKMCGSGKKERLNKDEADTNSCEVSSQDQLDQARMFRLRMSEEFAVVEKKTRAKCARGTQKDNLQVSREIQAIFDLGLTS